LAKPAILYVTYDGLLEPLGQSQVLAYVTRLAADFDIHLLSFEKKADWDRLDERQALRERIRAAGMQWYPLRYHKRPSAPATVYDIAAGTLTALRIARRHQVSLVHARSYVPALIALGVKRSTGIPYLFDMRGLWADERVDGRLWPADGAVYRTVKRLERTLLAEAAHVLTLTRASIPAIEAVRGRPAASHPPLEAISTFADLELFRPQPAASPREFTLGYVGSIGTWYLFDDVLDCFRLILERRTDARLLVLNRREQALVRERVAAAGIGMDRLELAAADHRQVPDSIARMTVGAAIIKPVFSKIASAPTKLAEYLGCGIPCLGNRGVGDMEEILEGERTGIALDGLSAPAKQQGIDRLFALLDDPELGARCRAVAERRFALDLGVATYRRIYQGLVR
jgi:glycosyltransferase involved in cell wall biosynthesis